MKTKTLFLFTVIWLPVMAFGQNPFDSIVRESAQSNAAGANTEWGSFKLDTKKRVKVSFFNASPDMIARWYAQQSGVSIISTPGFKTPLTFSSAGPISLPEAFSLFNTVLGLNQFELKKSANFLLIQKKEERRGGFDRGPGTQQTGTNPFADIDPTRLSEMINSGRPKTVIRALTYANASQVARVINELYGTPVTNQIEQLLQNAGVNTMMPGFGMPSTGTPNNNNNNNNNNRGGRGGGDESFYTVPGDDQLLAQRGGGGGGGRGGQGGGGFNFGGFNLGNLFGGQNGRGGRGGQNAGATARATYDEYTNSVIVVATDSQQAEIKAIIDKLDRAVDTLTKVQSWQLQFADAEVVAPLVQSLLTANPAKGAGGTAVQTQTQTGGGGFGQRGGNQNQNRANTASGNVIADPRTNKLIVTATEENLALVNALITEVDKDVPIVGNAYVIPISNGSAESIATMLAPILTANGNRTNTGTNRNNATGNAQTRQNNQRTNNAGGGTGGGGNGGGGGATGGGGRAESLEVDLEDPNAESGPLATQVTQGTGNQRGQGPDGRLQQIADLAGVQIVADPRTNQLIVIGTPQNVQVIRDLIAQLDKVTEQVMIETIIVEATLDSTDRFGIEWTSVQNNILNRPGSTGTGGTSFGLQTANPALQGFRYTVTGGDLTGFLNALKSDSKFEVLSKPRIFTTNNIEGTINISQRVPYLTSSRTDVNGFVTNSYSFEDVGIVLTVTPQITPNGQIAMQVVQTASELQDFTDFGAPIINQREANTTVSVGDGDTIILGGMIRSTVNSTVKKIPILGDIPLLGQLFKSTDNRKVKTELIVFLTPRIVRSPEEARKLREDAQKELSPGIQKQLEKEIRPAIAPIPPKTLSPTPKPEEKQP